ncbi:hypothetical protein ACQP1G_20600 [Nocardia sp. CA-107356]|uniref:hypothetical protein n=1 Tax=Nocardia sp. CA-107356 TaxID=3239972 RepID=UPI003D8E59B4
MPALSVRALPVRDRVNLTDVDLAERELGLTIICPYPRCHAPVQSPCVRTDVTGRRCVLRLLHMCRINTAKRENTIVAVEPPKVRSPRRRRRSRTTITTPTLGRTARQRPATPDRHRRRAVTSHVHSPRNHRRR